MNSELFGNQVETVYQGKNDVMPQQNLMQPGPSLQQSEPQAYVQQQLKGPERLGAILTPLNNLTFLALNLESCQLQLQDIEDLKGGLLVLDRLTQLTLYVENNNIGNEGAEVLGEGLANLQKLQKLTLGLEANNITNRGADFLDKIISRLQLESLNILGHQFLKSLTAIDMAIKKGISKSLELNLEESKIGVEGATALGRKIGEMHAFTALSLNLDDNEIEDRGVEGLVQEMHKLENISKFFLSLKEKRNNNQATANQCNQLITSKLGDVAAQYLAMQIAKLSNITELEICLEGNVLGDMGIQALALGCINLKRLTKLYLDLGYNSIGNFGVQSFGIVLPQLRNITHLKIDLKNNQFNSRQTTSYGQNIQGNQQFPQAIPNFNLIRDEGARQLGAGLIHLQHLVQLNLNLDSSLIGDDGLNDLALALERLLLLTDLSLQLNDCQNQNTKNDARGYPSINKISNVAAKGVAKALQLLTNLTHLNLGLKFNAIGNLGAQELGNAFCYLRQLTHLKLNITASAFTYYQQTQYQQGNIGSVIIEDEGMVALKIQSLTNLTNLTLRIGNNLISNQGAKYLGEQLLELQQLTQLTLDLQDQVNPKEQINSKSLDCRVMIGGGSMMPQSLCEIGDVGGEALWNSVKLLPYISKVKIELNASALGQAATKARSEAGLVIANRLLVRGTNQTNENQQNNGRLPYQIIDTIKEYL